MTADAKLMKLAAKMGVFDRFKDMQGVLRPTSPDTARALLRAQGVAASTEREVSEALAAFKAGAAQSILSDDVVVTAGKASVLPIHLPGHRSLSQPVEWQVTREQTGALLAEGRAGPDVELPALPLGVHQFHISTGAITRSVNLLAAPERAPSLPDVAGQDKTWGVMTALYGLQGAVPKALGDFDDLGAFAEAFGAMGAGFLGINPVHALGYAAHDTISPYSPTHRGFLNSDHIAFDGAEHEATTGALVDYAAHRATQRPALERAFAGFQSTASAQDRAAFKRFCEMAGPRLEDFAVFETLSEAHGPDWRCWPAALRYGECTEVAPDRVLFHKWLQWQADRQLGAAQQRAKSSGMALGLYLDLAVGARAGGAESWGQTAAAAKGVTLGAPPDHLSPAGQNWQLAALDPSKLQKTGYAALRHVLRAAMRHSGLLRIDHALGLSRSYWIPEDGSPGGYIRQNFDALTAVIAIEAARSDTVVVGEDLGLVPKGFRSAMAARGFYGYSVLQYEKDAEGVFLPISRLRAQSLACFGTHDTPTLAGFWEGHDIAWWEKLGWITRNEAERVANTRLTEKRALVGIPAPAPLPPAATPGLRDTVHVSLAGAPAALVAVQLDDIVLTKEAQNLPGTVTEHPNWRRRTTVAAADLAARPEVVKTAEIMKGAGRANALQRTDHDTSNC